MDKDMAGFDVLDDGAQDKQDEKESGKGIRDQALDNKEYREDVEYLWSRHSGNDVYRRAEKESKNPAELIDYIINDEYMTGA